MKYVASFVGSVFLLQLITPRGMLRTLYFFGLLYAAKELIKSATAAGYP